MGFSFQQTIFRILALIGVRKAGVSFFSFYTNPTGPPSPVGGAEIEVYKKMPQSFSKIKKQRAIAGEIRPLIKPDVDKH